jgi:hypothetical protein
MKKLIKIFDQYYNVDNIDVVVPMRNTDGDKEIGCIIWHNCAMDNKVFNTKIMFGKKEDGSMKHTTAEVIEALNKGEDLDD